MGWLYGFYGITYQPFEVIKRQIHFYTNEQFHFKQFSLVWVNSLIVNKTFLFQAIQFGQTVLNQTSQFSSIWSIDRTQSGATIPGHSGPGSDGNE